ncbi:MAG: sulfite exporter TauE/SafE family protein, partial [Rhodobacteraceae bacterium]|nr:sulfite exporter TauE/SafE family protein [Paracoccaceae bacterium]
MALGLFTAAYVRGYSGFGFAALVVSSASLVTNPLHFVPVVILADFLLTGMQARQIWGHIDWTRAGMLFLGCLIGVPLGVSAITAVGIDVA